MVSCFYASQVRRNWILGENMQFWAKICIFDRLNYAIVILKKSRVNPGMYWKCSVILSLKQIQSIHLGPIYWPTPYHPSFNKTQTPPFPSPFPRTSRARQILHTLLNKSSISHILQVTCLFPYPQYSCSSHQIVPQRSSKIFFYSWRFTPFCWHQEYDEGLRSFQDNSMGGICFKQTQEKTPLVFSINRNLCKPWRAVSFYVILMLFYILLI